MPGCEPNLLRWKRPRGFIGAEARTTSLEGAPTQVTLLYPRFLKHASCWKVPFAQKPKLGG